MPPGRFPRPRSPRPFPFAWFDRLTTNGASLREPPLRLSKGLNGCMLTTNGRPLLSQGWSGVYAGVVRGVYAAGYHGA